MMHPSNFVVVGKLVKTHGVKGEISARISNDFIDISDFPYIFCQIDGLFVPFFMEEVRPKTDVICLIKLETIDTEQDAKELTGLEFFLPKELLADHVTERTGWENLIGFSVTDEKEEFLGNVESVDDSTLNVLLCIKNAGKELLIPANEHFIIHIDSDKKIIHAAVPEELLRLN